MFEPMFNAFAGALLMFTMTFAGFGCDASTRAASSLPEPKSDVPVEAGESKRTAVLAAGCFWCVEAVFEQLAGVSEVVSGYTGGAEQTADYERVSRGDTEHAEAVRITYDPSKIGFAELLRVFFATHDPTQVNRQGPDVGSQYRSAIFYASPEEKRVAEQYIAQLEESGVFEEPIATTLEPLEGFYEAEGYHQDFVERNPSHPYVRMWAEAKLEKTRKLFTDKIGGDPADK